MTGGSDGVAAAWDLDAMACPRTFTALDQPVLALSISAGAQYVAYGGQQEMVPIETLEPGATPSCALVCELKLHPCPCAPSFVVCRVENP